MADQDNFNEVKKVTNAWMHFTNPLRSLTAPEIERLLNNARLGDDVRLQLAYYEIERSTPVFSTCISKRLAGMQSRQWAITTIVNSDLARAQQETV